MTFVFLFFYFVLSKINKEKRILLSLLISILLTFIGNYAFEIFNDYFVKSGEIDFDYLQPGVTEKDILQIEGENCVIDRSDILVTMEYDDVSYMGTEGMVTYWLFQDYGLIMANYGTKSYSVDDYDKMKSWVIKNLSGKYGVFTTKEIQGCEMHEWLTKDEHIITLMCNEEDGQLYICWWNIYWLHKIKYK